MRIESVLLALQYKSAETLQLDVVYVDLASRFRQGAVFNLKMTLSRDQCYLVRPNQMKDLL